jgi:hypothetical protein
MPVGFIWLVLSTEKEREARDKAFGKYKIEHQKYLDARYGVKK